MAKMEHIYTLERMKTWSKDLSDNEIEAIAYALKTLNQEPCEDTISRQAVIDGINKYFHDEYYQRTSIQDCRDCLIEDVIKNLPSVTPAQEWIPCSERLPEKNTAVLTYVSTGPSETYCLAYWNDVRDGWEEWIGYELIEKDRGYKVLAWMPLPGSYDGDKKDD